jgi:macrolide transport system ATP-binding/permease protein
MLGNGKKADVDVAIGDAYPRLLLQEIEYGRPVASGSSDRLVVLSKPVAEKLFGSSQSALSQSVLLWGKRFQVVGVSKEIPKFGFNMGGVSRQRAVFLSAACATKTEGLTPSGFVVLRTDSSTNHDLQMSIASSILSFRHRGVDDFEFFDFRAFIAKFDTVFFALRIIVAIIGGVSRVIAGAGIMNVMMASVRARVAEIGVRRAIGATQSDIRRQFLIESVLIAGIGGAFGTVCGSALSLCVGSLLSHATVSWVNHLPSAAPACAFLCAVLIGIVFGMRPAQSASRLDVVACLRGESA